MTKIQMETPGASMESPAPQATKKTYIKLLRTIVEIDARYADQIRDLLNAPAPQPPVEGLREALEFYANPFAWKAKHDPDDVVRIPDFYSETSFGDTAIEALAALASPSLTAGPWRNDELPETGQWIDVRAETTFRYLSYKPNSEQRRKGIKGRWQRSNGYGGWENCEKPTGDWRLNLPLAAPATLTEQPSEAPPSAPDGIDHAAINRLRKEAFKLSPAEQYRLAFFIAENVGYVLEREHEHPDSPHTPAPQASTDFFSESVDAWGALEWFDRMAKAIRGQDAAVVAKDDAEMEICQNVAASSAMRLVRGYEQIVRAALAPQPPVEGLREAFIAGATAVHKEWLASHERGEDHPPRGEPDFSEAATDYAALASPPLTAEPSQVGLNWEISAEAKARIEDIEANTRRAHLNAHNIIAGSPATLTEQPSEAPPSAPDVREASERVLQSLNALASGLLSPDQNETSTAMAAEAARAIEDATIIHDFLSAPPVADREAIARVVRLLRTLNFNYRLNDCDDRPNDDALEMPITVFREANAILALLSAQPAKGER